MAKIKKGSIFFCQECGYESSKWMGQCPGCKAWNSFVEEMVNQTSVLNSGKSRMVSEKKEPSVLSAVSLEKEDRVLTGIEELDRVLGGGIVNNKVLENCNIDPNEYSGLAFGIGIERIAMLKYGINHMGKLFENDVEFLKQFKA